jgi:uncharacterized membrane protein YkvA (DUF1232 family)
MDSNLFKIVLMGFGVALVLYALFVVVLIAVGRKQDARAWGGFIPDCIVLFKRLLGDSRVPRSRKLLLVLLVAYLSLPFDLVPDFIPIAGQLDDVVIVVLVLRSVLRSVGEDDVRRHWPGPESSINRVLTLVNWRHG